MFRTPLARCVGLAALLNGLVLLGTAADKITNPEELVAKHLGSIGSDRARSEVKSRADEGLLQFRILSGGTGLLAGKSVLLSEGRKLLFMMSLPNNEYHGERFIFDGDKLEVRTASAQQARSSLGEFVYLRDAIVREGLLGGVLSTAWPLLNLDERKPKLSYEGLKNMEGRQLHDLRYHPKNSDLNIHLYFDPDTFQHLRTVYTLTIEPALAGHNSRTRVPGASETLSASQNETRYRLEERFRDFSTVDGLTLPNHYTIQFTQELQNGRTVLSQWDNTVKAIKQNVSPDPRNFQVK